MAYLVLIHGVEPGKKFPLGGAESVIGRSSECQVALDVAAVSRRHAAVLREGDAYFVEDMGSRNGTILNGSQILGRMPLAHGDRVQVCDQEFEFRDEAARSLHGGPTEAFDGESSLVQVVGDEDDTANVMATLDLGPGSASWSLTAKPEVKLAALVEITTNLGRVVELRDAFSKIVDSLFKIFVQADRAFVVTRPKPDGPLIPVEARSRRQGDEEKLRISRTIVQKAMNAKQAVLSADASSDERFGMAQSIAEFKIRSMMCAPMIDSDGEAIGVIQVDTSNQRSRFTDEDLEVLAAVASQAAVAIDNTKMHAQVLSQRALARDLELASRMQRNLLPSGPPKAEGYHFFDYYEAARMVGGDYYDYIPLPGGRFAVIVGDVAGKGVAAAILMARLSADVRFSLATEPDVAQAVMSINRAFAAQGWDDRFVTMIVAVVDPLKHEMTLVNAGHMAPLLRSAGGMVEEVAGDIAGLPLGVYEDYEYESATRPLAPGDFITIFTDGFSEAMNAERELYGLERLSAAIGRPGVASEALGNYILEDVRKFVGGTAQSDDMCLACFGRRGA